MTKGVALKIGKVLARGLAEYDITSEEAVVRRGVYEALRIIEYQIGDTRRFSVAGCVDDAREDIERELSGEDA